MQRTLAAGTGGGRQDTQETPSNTRAGNFRTPDGADGVLKPATDRAPGNTG